MLLAVRLARYCARHPLALGRLAYGADTGTVTYQSDKASGPTAGAETLEALEFLARVVSHIPNKGQVLQRYYGWYANRTRGIRRRAGAPEPAPAVAAESLPPALQEARHRWAELLHRQPAPVSTVRPRDAHRRLYYPALSDRPDSMTPPAALGSAGTFIAAGSKGTSRTMAPSSWLS
ncbi:MAG: transposase [Gemmatimonadales bacterium]|nr:transposase [Gemmatimonadales bacterium]